MSNTYNGPQVGQLPPAQVMVPGDKRTLGYGTDQGRFLAQSIQSSSGAANPFRCASFLASPPALLL